LKQRLRPLCYPSGFEQNRKLNKITDETRIDLTELKLKTVFWSRGGHGGGRWSRTARWATGTRDWAQKERVAAGNQFHAAEGAGGHRRASGGEVLRRKTAVNAGGRLHDENQKGRRSRRFENPPGR
jgi:hypothetical protein